MKFFRKFLRFGSANLPHSTPHCLVTSFHISNQSFKTKFCLDSLFLSFLLLHLAIILGLPIIASPTILSTTALDHFLLRFRPNGGVLSKWAGGKRTSRKMLALIFFIFADFFIIAAHSRGRRRDHRLLVQVQQPITLPAVSAHTYWALPEKKRSSIEIVKIPHIEKT